jgi:hypothetical protein
MQKHCGPRWEGFVTAETFDGTGLMREYVLLSVSLVNYHRKHCGHIEWSLGPSSIPV